MAKGDFDDEDEEFDDSEDEEELDEEPKAKPKKIVAQTNRPIRESVRENKKEAEASTTYSSYHIPERIGVKNDSTNETIGEDIFTVLASIKNDIQQLKEGLL